MRNIAAFSQNCFQRCTERVYFEPVLLCKEFLWCANFDFSFSDAGDFTKHLISNHLELSHFCSQRQCSPLNIQSIKRLQNFSCTLISEEKRQFLTYFCKSKSKQLHTYTGEASSHFPRKTFHSKNCSYQSTTSQENIACTSGPTGATYPRQLSRKSKKKP